MDLEDLELELETLRTNINSQVNQVQSEFRKKEAYLTRKIAIIKDRTKVLNYDEEEMRMARGLPSNKPKHRRKTVTK